MNRRYTKKVDKAVKEARKELRNLYLAWEEYLGKGVVAFMHKNRFVFFGLVSLFFLGSICLLIKNVVYTQPELSVSESLCSFRLGKTFFLAMGGSVLGGTIRLARRNYCIFKRGVDLFASVLGIIITLPLFFIVALLVKIDSSGSIFFKQERTGKRGKGFKMWKFRTMRSKAELETGPVWAQDSDPRITKIGRFLRKSHLDELPQLINVLRGEMSLVGPRPERPELIEVINKHIPHFHQRLDIRPGITGLAQVRYSYGASIKDAARKLKYDLIYRKRMSFFLDSQVMFWTVGKIFTGEGAR